jgi:hypothetical protein
MIERARLRELLFDPRREFRDTAEHRVGSGGTQSLLGAADERAVRIRPERCKGG